MMDKPKEIPPVEETWPKPELPTISRPPGSHGGVAARAEREGQTEAQSDPVMRSPTGRMGSLGLGRTGIADPAQSAARESLQKPAAVIVV
jgi:hypothetical protein